MLVNIFLSIAVGLALHYFVGIQLIHSMIIGTLLVIILSIFKYLTKKDSIEGFSSNLVGGGTNPRFLRYGDKVAIYTSSNRFVTSSGNRVSLSPELQKSTDLPNTMEEAIFTLISPFDKRASGRRNVIQYGDIVAFKSSDGRYLRADAAGSFVNNTNVTREWEQFTIGSPEIEGNEKKNIKYGINMFIKSYHNNYFSGAVNNRGLVLQTSLGPNTNLIIVDQYGDGQEVNWARRGIATQSSEYRGGMFPAINSISPNLRAFSHTNNQESPWWQVKLPKDINITKVVIENRRDCCQDRLSDFSLIVLDSQREIVFKKDFKNEILQTYEINGISTIGRIVRVQSNIQNILNISEVRVYGDSVNYNNINKPLSADIITSNSLLTENDTLIFNQSDIPHINSSRSSSYLLQIRPGINNQSTRSILRLGEINLKMENQKPIIEIVKNQNKYVLSSSQTMLSEQSTHIAIVLNNGILPSTDWMFGEFNETPPEGPSRQFYLVNNNLREYYHVSSKPSAFSLSSTSNWNVNMVHGMKYMGEYKDDLSNMTIEFYINGFKVDSKSIPEKINSLLPMLIGNDEENSVPGINGVIERFSVANFSVTKEQIITHGYANNNQAIHEVIRGVQDMTNKEIKISPFNQPDFKLEMTLMGWINISRPNTGGDASIIFNRENQGKYGPLITLDTASNKLKYKFGDKAEGMSKTNLQQDRWYYLTLTCVGKIITLYIDGQVEDQVNAGSDIEYNNVTLTVGKFPGKLKSVKLSNYSMSEDEIFDNIGKYPDWAAIQDVKQVLKLEGCPSGDPMGDVDLITLMKRGHYSRVVEKIRNYKNILETKPNDKVALNICYGKRNTGLNYAYNNAKKALELNPSDFEMYGPWIGKYIPVKKILSEGDKIVYIIKHGKHVKIVKEDTKSKISNGFFYEGEISEYGTKDLKRVTVDGGYMIRKKPQLQSNQSTKLVQGQGQGKIQLVQGQGQGKIQLVQGQGQQQTGQANQSSNQSDNVSDQVIDEVVKAKADLSTDASYQSIIDQVSMLKSRGLGQHPNTQLLIQKLNRVGLYDVMTKNQKYQELEQESRACNAVFNRIIKNQNSELSDRLIAVSILALSGAGGSEKLKIISKTIHLNPRIKQNHKNAMNDKKYLPVYIKSLENAIENNPRIRQAFIEEYNNLDNPSFIIKRAVKKLKDNMRKYYTSDEYLKRTRT